MVAVVGIICLFIIICYAIKIYRRFDHSGWKKGSSPDYNAEIVKVNQIAPGGLNVKTVIDFSDGFYFITYRTMTTEIAGGFKQRRFELSTDMKMLTRIAGYAHEKAVRKKLGK